jgi:4-hydroxybenzoate polyprenyltransferase
VLVLQALGVALASLGGGGLAAMACGGTVAATYLYNGLLKDGPLGPLAMGLCRYGNATIGLAALGVGPQAAPVAYALPLGTLLYVAAITAVSRYEVSGTPGPGLHRALVAMLAWAAAPAVGAATGALLPWAAAAAVAAPAALVRPVRAAWGGGGPAVRGAVRAGIFGIALVNAALAVGAGAPLTAALIVALALAGRRFGRWFSAT